MGLEITGKRKDGYHNLKTVFQTVSLYDTLEVEVNSAGKLNLDGSDKSVEWDQNNTIAKVYAVFREHCNIEQGFDVFVHKRIPPGSGLGGGSSNAAVFLLFLNEGFNARLGAQDLIQIAARTGADVPFFLVGGTVLGEGIGEKMTSLEDLEETTFAIVVPNIKVSTGLIFSKLNLTRRPFKSKIDTFVKNKEFPVLENKLEEITFELFPEVKAIKDKMLNRTGCDFALMSGSGAAVYCTAQRQDITGLKNLFPGCAAFIVKTIKRQDYLVSIGASPSGKAPVFGAGIRRFESCRPSHSKKNNV